MGGRDQQSLNCGGRRRRGLGGGQYRLANLPSTSLALNFPNCAKRTTQRLRSHWISTRKPLAPNWWCCSRPVQCSGLFGLGKGSNSEAGRPGDSAYRRGSRVVVNRWHQAYTLQTYGVRPEQSLNPRALNRQARSFAGSGGCSSETCANGETLSTDECHRCCDYRHLDWSRV
jgi:hypothetical protein